MAHRTRPVPPRPDPLDDTALRRLLEALAGDCESTDGWEDAAPTCRQATARIEALSAQVDDLTTYAREVSIAFVHLSGGGSEMFKRVGDEFYVDPDPCCARIQEKIDVGHNMLRKSAKAGLKKGLPHAD